MSACCRQYPGRSERTEIARYLFPRRRPSPGYRWVSTCITSFEACSAFIRVTTCRLAESPYATLYTGGSGGFVASTAAPVATGWSDPVPGRVFLPLWNSAFSRRTVTLRLRVKSRFCDSYQETPTDRPRSRANLFAPQALTPS